MWMDVNEKFRNVKKSLGKNLPWEMMGRLGDEGDR